jgi:hypothetical protein
MSNTTKKSIALALSGFTVITTLWLSLYAISVRNSSAKQAQAGNRVASNSASYNRAGF